MKKVSVFFMLMFAGVSPWAILCAFICFPLLSLRNSKLLREKWRSFLIQYSLKQYYGKNLLIYD